MAGLARGREPGLRVWRVVGGVEILLVAANTGRRCPFVFPANVAREAIERRVYSGQREARKFQVVEFRAGPAVHGVAGGASCREIRTYVARARCALKIFQVTGSAIG